MCRPPVLQVMATGGHYNIRSYEKGISPNKGISPCTTLRVCGSFSGNQASRLAPGAGAVSRFYRAPGKSTKYFCLAIKKSFSLQRRLFMIISVFVGLSVYCGGIPTANEETAEVA